MEKLWSIEFASPTQGAANGLLTEVLGRGETAQETGRLGWEFTGSKDDVLRVHKHLKSQGDECYVTGR